MMGKLIDVKDWEKADKLILLRGWKRNGLTNKQIAENIGISERTFYLWMKKSKVISQTMLLGKQHAKFIVENALFEKARNGNTTAMIFWLKNNWREKYTDSILTSEERQANVQKTRKLKAEADLAEARAKEFIEDTSDYNEVQLVFTDRTKKGQDDAD